MSAPYYSDPTVTLHHGDCIDVLRELADCSVDAVVTDPPYGLEFMGKEWDAFKPASAKIRKPSARDLEPGAAHNETTFLARRNMPDAIVAGHPFQQWCEQWAAECLRVLKPGAFILAFGGTRTFHRLACAIEDAGFEIRDSLAWIHGQGFPKNANALKPAFEPVVVARKPLAGTVAQNVLQWGTGALNIDGTRIEGGTRPLIRNAGKADPRGEGFHGKFGSSSDGETSQGRWPANVILDGSQAAALDEMSGEIPPSTRTATGGECAKPGQLEGHLKGVGSRVGDSWGYNGSGGASRFFYTAKAGTNERITHNGVAHPTVKPLDLMRWLVRLVTPPGGIILEPFAGSGTTVEAAILEGFRCIAIEREADYLPLIVQRINRRRDPVAYLTNKGEDMGLFGPEDAA